MNIRQKFLPAPKTRGKTLEQMDQAFNSGDPAWRSSKVLGGSGLDKLEKHIEKKQVTVEILVLMGKEDKLCVTTHVVKRFARVASRCWQSWNACNRLLKSSRLSVECFIDVYIGRKGGTRLISLLLVS